LERLMAERDALAATVERLREAGQAIVERWDSPNWKDAKHTGEYIVALRDAIAAATEGGGAA
jgi:hypothetical protein